MNVRKLLGKLQKTLSRYPLAVRLALLLRNQCNCIIQYYLCSSNNHSKNGEAWLANLIAPQSSTFIDVGANIGDWSVIFLDSMPKNSKAILFEPSDNAMHQLRLRFEQVECIDLVKAAVSDSPGKMYFFEEPDAGETSSLVGNFSQKNALKKLVNVTTIDAEVQKRQWEYVDFLKIDTEGYDLHVLRGASTLLSQHKIGVLQFEYNAPWATAGSLLSEAYKMLESFGYKVFLLKESGLFELNYNRYGEYFSYSNFVAVEPERIKDIQTFIKGSI
ncbi:FkbM family methyltransferase [Cylindrospermum sp. FACHB-282]|uniref:FkbM family methyltransferase n=1 Tax=Cylindrospermum sp. FACHB-282 TaxID=2692794 RepID=UPI0016822378|nr:FkbM family methyltransferase [Cylindrospermum sp. FACHB-282]MBD2385326.1 FkbM family methyltransferase [Cylindrospermum sp. FACHB-282]